MVWEIIKIGAGAYVAFVIAAKNPTVADAIGRFHEATTAFTYKWVPVLYKKIVELIKSYK